MDESKTITPTSQRPRLSEMQGTAGNGIACRKCGCRHFEVVYTRAKPGCIRRLRECRNCGHRMATWERA